MEEARCSRCDEPHDGTDHATDRGCLLAVQNALAVFRVGLNGHERHVLERVVDRIKRGRRSYGPWYPKKPIDYNKEILEELIDVILYYVLSSTAKEPHGGDEKPQGV